MIVHWIIVGVCIALGMAIAPLVLWAALAALGVLMLIGLFLLPFLPLVALLVWRGVL